MLSLVFCFCLCGFAAAEFKATDCSNTNAAVTVSNWVMPDPIPDGGRYRVQLTMTVTRTIPGNSKLHISICRQYLFGVCIIPFPTCADDYGDCTFQVCNRPGFPHYNPLFEACTGNGVGTIKPGVYNIDKYVYFPGLGPGERLLVDGQATGAVTITNSGGQQIGCWNLKFNIQKSTHC